jgi:hypothetical protein
MIRSFFKDARLIPNRDWDLFEKLGALMEDPDWLLVKSNMTGQWIPIRITNYITDLSIHLNRYCNEFDRS